MLITFVLLTILAFGSQVVLSSSSLQFSIQNVEQCGPVAITFEDTPSTAYLPLTLTVLPFNSSPITIPVPNQAVTSQTIGVTFFPLEEGTQFIVSLDDALGNSYASDVMAVQPSSTGNSSCLPTTTTVGPQQFSLDGPVSQCQPFNITYNVTLINRPPSIRAFTPLHHAFAINETDPQTNISGMETYLMSASRQTEVVLLFDDGAGYRETSSLLTVGGDSSSNDTCVQLRKGNSDQMDKKSQTNPTKGEIIGISVVIGIVVVGMAVLMKVYITRERRRRRRVNFVKSRMVKPSPSASSSPYLSEKAPSPAAPEPAYYPGESGRSLEEASQGQSPPIIHQNGEKIADMADLSMNHSLSALDIEHILNMATVHSEPPLPPPSVAPAAPALLAVPPRIVVSRHLRDPSDVPSDLSPHQSISALFPPRPESRESSASYPPGPLLTVASQPNFSSYSPPAPGRARSIAYPTSWQLNATLERISSFPVSVTSLPPSQRWDVEGNPGGTPMSTSSWTGRAE